MALENWYVKELKREDIKTFIEKWHYSGSINGCISDYCYGLFSPDGALRGAMFFGRMAMAGQYKRFVDKEEDIIELRRLCCIDDTPRNAESYFISRALKLLKKKWMGKVVVSYADREHGHTGIIYKASNFTQVGNIPGAKVIVYKGKSYHDKAIRTRYKGKLKPFAVKLKKALDSGEAYFKETKGKCTYIYNFD